MNASQIVAIVLVALACVPDIRTRRIPNALTFGAAAAAIVFHTVGGGWHGLSLSVGGWFVGALLFFPVFVLRGMGAGDVKLLAAVGAWLGPATVVWVALLTLVAGGVMGIGVALFYGYLRTAFANIWMLLMHWRVAGVRPLPAVSLEQHRGPRLAYAVPIAVGTVMTLWLK